MDGRALAAVWEGSEDWAAKAGWAEVREETGAEAVTAAAAEGRAGAAAQAVEGAREEAREGGAVVPGGAAKAAGEEEAMARAVDRAEEERMAATAAVGLVLGAAGEAEGAREEEKPRGSRSVVGSVGAGCSERMAGSEGAG